MRRPGFFAGCAIKPARCATILDFVKGTVNILKKGADSGAESERTGFRKEVNRLRIAICDDDRDEIIKIQHIIAEIHGNYQVDAYQSGKAMLEAAEKGENMIWPSSIFT